MKILRRDAAVIAERGTESHWTQRRPGRRSGAERHKPEYSPPKEKTTGNGPFAGVLKMTGRDSRLFALSMGAVSVGSIFVGIWTGRCTGGF